MSRIVVGVDGSDHAIRALRWAVGDARRRGAELDVVHAVPIPLNLADPILMPPPPEHDLRLAGAEVIAEALAEVEVEELAVKHTVMIGQAASVLCDEATGAELLVIGSRGLGGFKGLLVGSVTQQVIAHAPCPVLVVVPEAR